MRKLQLVLLLSFLVNGATLLAQCPTAPALDEPAAGATNVSTFVTLRWASVNADEYDIYLATTGACTVAQPVGTSRGNSFNPPQLQPNTSYEWRVVARKSSCPSASSSCRRFTTGSAGSTCPTTPPALRSPADGATGITNPVELRWEKINDNSATYAVFAGIDGASPSLVATVTDDRITRSFSGSTVDWYVEARPGSTCGPLVSSRARFTMAARACSRENATNVSPADGATGITSPVTFQWTPVSGATSYRVFGSIDGGSIGLLGTTSATQLTVPIAAGKVSWTVEATFGGDCVPTISPRTEFTVASGSCPTTPPQISAPANGAALTALPVEFKWSPVTGASSYEIYVSVGGDAFTQIGETRQTSFTQAMPAGEIQWYVEAKVPGCRNLKSATSRFSVSQGGACTTVTVTPVSPANGSSVASPVTFNWTEVPGATGYRLWVALDDGAPALLARPVEQRATLALPSGQVVWFVEAVRDNCPPAISQSWRLTVQQAANCGSLTAPSPVSPVSAGSTPVKVTENVTFTWTAAAGATLYRVWASKNGGPLDDIGVTTETQLTRELSEGVYSWFVQAFFAGCPSLSSARATFEVDDNRDRCPTIKPVLLSPVGSTNVSSPVQFAWSSVAGAKKYRVYLFGGGEAILLGETSETQMTRPLSPGSFSWSVEAVFEECPARRAEPAQFTIPRASNCSEQRPQLLAPAEGETSTQPVVFAWTQVSNASRYALIVKPQDGAPTPLAETPDVTFSRRLPAGKYEWWVVAFVSGCPATISDRRQLTVTRPAACDVRPPAILSPEDDAVVAKSVTFAWTPVSGAKSYRVRVLSENGDSAIIAVTTETQVTRELPPGKIRWYVEATFDSCSPLESAVSDFAVEAPAAGCTPPRPPVTRVVGQALAGTTYTLRWLPVPSAAFYEVQESTEADFATATTQSVQGASTTFNHTTEAPTRFYYRTRGVSSCSDQRGPYSDAVSVLVVPERAGTSQKHASAEAGTQVSVGQKVLLPAQNPPVSFTATVDEPWLTVTPSAGTVGAEGATLVIGADPKQLPPGTSTGTLIVTYGSAANAGPYEDHGTTSAVVPVSVSLVTPVVPSGKNTPPSDAFIIPAVAHAEGANSSMFESDVRIANLSAQAMRYQLNFTPSGVDGTTAGSSSSIEIAAGATMAIDDILANFFGTSGAATGMLEIRPASTSAASSSLYTTTSPSTSRTTVASSRAYNTTPTGTFGQFIPAIPFSQFIGKASGSAKNILSLQQIAQSADYRTNVGLVEAAGEPADVVLSVFDNANVKVGSIPVSLLPGEHRQLNALLAANGIALTDGRIEVEVTSSTGKVTAYASVLDNKTSDPLLVSPVLKSSVSATRYTLPGMADLVTSANWRSDVRVFNAGNNPVATTLAFYPQGNPAGVITRSIDIAAGEVKVLDNVLQSLFGVSNAGGSIVVATASSSTLVASARTYNLTSTGTYGQFIPGVTPQESTGNGGRSLQLLQLEQSTRFRTNVGVAETSGKAATVEISATAPDSKVTAKVEVPLQASEFRQIPLSSFPDFATVYNARVSVKVVSGDGTVTAYGSVIDMQTQDPTYVPAQ